MAEFHRFAIWYLQYIMKVQTIILAVHPDPEICREAFFIQTKIVEGVNINPQFTGILLRKGGQIKTKNEDN
jgi:hypothetical protein